MRDGVRYQFYEASDGQFVLLQDDDSPHYYLRIGVLLALLFFAVLGAAAGRIAFSLVEEGVTSKLRDELASKTKK